MKIGILYIFCQCKFAASGGVEMKKHKIRKRLISSALSAAMLLSAVSVPFNTAFATEVYPQTGGTTIYSDFEDGVGLPWAVRAVQPFMYKFDISDGTYNVSIKDNQSGTGDGMFDMGLRHKDISLHEKVVYYIHAEITADQDGWIYTRIGSLDGTTDVWRNSFGATGKHSGYEGTDDMNQSWDRLPVKANETLFIDASFCSDADYEDLVWDFDFGGAGQFNDTDCFPEGTMLHFDNLILYNEIDGAPDESSHPKELTEKPFAVNQFGYPQYGEKKAILYSDTPITEDDFFVMDAYNNLPVYRNYLMDYSAERDPASGKYTAVADFSKIELEGLYYLSFRGTSRDSYDFPVSYDLYESVLTDAVNFFYQSRGGEPIKKQYITSKGRNRLKSDLAHDAFLPSPDTGYIQNEWVKNNADGKAAVNTELGTVEAKGGWLEPENCAKSVISGAVAAWTLMNLYEHALNYGNVSRFDRLNCEVVTPEEFNTTPDILDEVRYELDFLMSMTVPKDLTYSVKPFDSEQNDTGEYAGMLFHQIQYSRYVSPDDAPDAAEKDDAIKRIVQPPTTAATLAGAAVFAQASRLFDPYDTDYANKLRDAAVSAYEAAKKNPQLFAPCMDAVSSRSVVDSCTDDEFYWAACELYTTTREEEYLVDLTSTEDYAYELTPYVNNSTADGYSAVAFNENNTAGYGTLTLALHSYLLPFDDSSKVMKNIESAAYTFLQYCTSNSAGVPYVSLNDSSPLKESSKSLMNYENCSNGMILNNAIVLAYAYNNSGIEAFRDGAIRALSYIFGCNPNGISYVTGKGTRTVRNPLHYFWRNGTELCAPDGVLVSGPNSALSDPVCEALGMNPEETAPQLCYTDNMDAWSVNSSGLALNASLAWLAAFFSTGDSAVYMNLDPEDPVIRGDVNEDQTINVSDAVCLMRYLRADMSFSENQYEAADLNGDGLINAIDLTLLKRLLVNGNRTYWDYSSYYF